MKTLSPTPFLKIDIEKTRQHIKTMSEKARSNALEFRPHFKTHQSLMIGSIFREYGTKGITVSSTNMAEYFMRAGWNDVTIAFPANILEINRYNKLSEDADLRLLVQSKRVCDLLSEGLNTTIGVYIELDPDYGRSGLSYTDIKSIRELADHIKKSNLLHFIGFYCHAGNSYKCNSRNEISELGKNILSGLEKIRSLFPDADICYGDTPTCSVLESFGPVSQLSPGNFVFYDLMQSAIGSCSEEDISVSLCCPVVEKKAERKQLIIHGGAVHLSKEFLSDSSGKHFGYVKGNKSSRLVSISQEHGIVECSEEFFNEIKIGDHIEILPVHSCLTADLMGSYSDLTGKYYDHLRSHYPG
ncbi:alanine racemase [Balneola sp. MJW-20]|uniref:alanine racemase n=1 Tax=Gracilimonas aurantiaca TaxID=3234185 RepID=UPI003464FEF2